MQLNFCTTYRYSPEECCRAPVLIPYRSMLHPMRYPMTMVYHLGQPLACTPMTNDDGDDATVCMVDYINCLIWYYVPGCRPLSYSPNTFDTNDFYLKSEIVQSLIFDSHWKIHLLFKSFYMENSRETSFILCTMYGTYTRNSKTYFYWNIHFGVDFQIWMCWILGWKWETQCP